MAKSRLALGLDIGSSSVKLVQLKEAKRGYLLEAFGVAPLPPEAIVDGALMNSTAIVEAIRGLVAQYKLKNREAAIGVSGHSVIIKKISMPKMTQEELEESIQWEAEQYIPFDVKDVNIDVQILTPADVDTGTGQMDVLLVAAKKDMINDYTSVVSEAGLTPVVVDVDAFAVQNTFEVNYELPKNETIVLVNAGASVCNINVLANGLTTFTRDVTMGGNQFTEEIQKQLNVSYDEAEKLKVGGDAGQDSDSVVPQEVERVIQGVADQMAGEIQRSLDFYTATAADSHIARLYLSGGTAKIPALFKVIEQRVGVPVEILNPFKDVALDKRIASTRAEIAQLEKTIGEVKSIKEDKKALEDKLKILDTLKRGRTGPVKVLDELATIIPAKVWLAEFSEQNGGVAMNGQAASYEDLSTFSKKLKASTHFTNITIKTARQRPDGTVDWIITCNANYSA